MDDRDLNAFMFISSIKRNLKGVKGFLKKYCFQISYCGRFEPNWKSWISGESGCEIPQCWVQGQCLGQTLDLEIVDNEDVCLAKCKSKSQCSWFTFFKSVSECILFRTCPAIDDTCIDCLSGEKNCIIDPLPGKFILRDLLKLKKTC